MPRKLFRKYLPSHESIRSNRFIAAFGHLLTHHNLWHLHRYSVAGGVAIGMFAGLIPGPGQMISAALLAVAFRVNLPVAVVTTWYTNPITIIPIYFVAFKLGTLLFGDGSNHVQLLTLSFADKSVSEWLPTFIQWITDMGKPFLLGLLVLALALTVIGYFAVLIGWRLYVVLAWRKRARDRNPQFSKKT